MKKHCVLTLAKQLIHTIKDEKESQTCLKGFSKYTFLNTCVMKPCCRGSITFALLVLNCNVKEYTKINNVVLECYSKVFQKLPQLLPH